MTITLEVTSLTAKRMEKEAQQAGVSLEEYAQQIVEQASPAPARTEMTAQQRAARFLRWAGSHPQDTPLLTEEEISREALYGRQD